MVAESTALDETRPLYTPDPTDAWQSDPWIVERKLRLLTAYIEEQSLRAACQTTGIVPMNHYNWLRADPNYAAAFDQAEKIIADNLEGEARRRAATGYNEPVFWRGQQVSTVRKYSDLLLIFLLKGAKPDKYRDAWQQNVQTNVQVKVYSGLPDDSGP